MSEDIDPVVAVADSMCSLVEIFGGAGLIAGGRAGGVVLGAYFLAVGVATGVNTARHFLHS